MVLGLPFACAAALILFVRNTIAQSDNSTFSLYANASDIYPPPSSPECAEALSSSIQCSELLIDAIPSSNLGLSNLTASDLGTLCVPTCYDSLITVASNVDSACGGWPFIISDTSYIASLPFRYFAYYWNLTCLFDSSASEYCLTEDQSSVSNTDQSILSLPLSQLCGFCNLQELNIQMTSAFGWDGSFVPEWEIIQGNCSFTTNNAIPSALLFNASNPLAANGTTANVTATPTLTPASNSSCVFGSYTIQSGDTCTSIAAAKSLSYDQLVSINGLDMNCTLLPPPGSVICLSGVCPLYTVQQNDTCVSIAAAKDIAWSQLLAWNPQINSYCSNLVMQVGESICVGPPGGGYKPTVTQSVVTGSPTALAIPTAPVAPGADRSICGLWYTAVTGDTCPQILSVFQLTNETFYELNPDVNGDCSNLLAGFSYCVAVYGNTTTTTSLFAAPTTPGIQFIQYIAGDFPAMAGYLTDIANVTATPSLPPTTTVPYTTTPTVNATIAPGSLNATQCLLYYEVQVGELHVPYLLLSFQWVIGDSCLAIEDVYDISESQLLTWNPEINAGCSNLVVGWSYCVFGLGGFTPTSITIPPSSTTSTTSTSTTSSASAIPTNVANGTTTSGCLLYYTVQSGDSCGGIESNFNITLTQFIAWNPEVNSQCTNIDVGLAYCVNGPNVTTTTTTTTASQTPSAAPIAPGTTSNCSQYYTVVSGDYCSLIDSKFGITITQFLAWNTGVDANCDNLLLGYQYCVAGPPVSTTSTPASTTTSPTASPTASGTTSQCTEYYTVQSGDTCYSIEQQYDITATQFLAWNSGLNSNCTNLELGYEYCVAGPS
ncbi:uncharacterized protein FIBRA_02618 [Fibroporia radiculosa]|uniref:LysM domain-containing protein n=1 Tax=Fibroporia radiculosa TaxID=599839 RepID=J4HV76_9APHY|nr:uncharacterized protein FIBRA_02618 [Fibroporia radiculosa]CCM00582.1 predicted protein [Fibroporia radiculosa]